MGQYIDTLDRLVGFSVVVSEEPDDGHLELVAAEVVDDYIDGTVVVSGHRVVQGCCRVVVDHRKHGEVGDVGGVHQSSSGSQAPVRGHCECAVSDLRSGLFAGVFLDVFQDHSDDLLDSCGFLVG